MTDEKPHYVNNAEFTEAVTDYCRKVKTAKKNEDDLPIVPDYIAKCFLKICEGLSHKANFVRYTYREEMIMDAVENCLRAVINYDIDTPTRTGKPNPFGYFTQISWYAFLRRIAKEKKQQDIKLKYIAESGMEELVDTSGDNDESMHQTQAFVDELRERIDLVKENDQQISLYEKKVKQKRRRKSDSDLGDFLE